MIGLLHFKPLIRILSMPGIPNVWSITLQARVVLSGQSWAPGTKAANWVATAFGSGKAARGSVYCVFSGWWFQIYLTFTLTWGDDPIWRSCVRFVFSMCPANTQFQSGHLVRCAILIVYIVDWLRYSYFIFFNYTFASIYHRWRWLTWASGFDPYFVLCRHVNHLD